MKRRTRSVADLHQDWLAQVETDGPFLALPVIKSTWPDGVDRLGDADHRMVTFKQAFITWQREVDAFALAERTPEAVARYADVTRAWIATVLDDLAGWSGLRVAADDLPSTFEVRSPGEQIVVRPSGALRGRDDGYAALLRIVDPTTSLRDTGLDGWAATEIDRMAMLLRKAAVEVGVVTDGQWWAIIWAKDGKPTGSGMVDALTWGEEPLLRDAFLTLLDQRRFRAKSPEDRLPRLFERSELEAEEITEALGTQVRRSVELLVQAFSEARLAAACRGDHDPLAEDPEEVYQAAVTVMMRVVFLLFAEEREMLPTEQLYWDSYAIRDLLTDLKRQAAQGEEPLDESFDAWHRLLAVSQALHGGVNYDEMRMPAYGGSLLDPDRFPWLHATDRRGRLRLEVSDRVMLHVLESVQTAVVKGERRRVSFRDIDVEQIGYIYEGLLGYSCAVVEDHVVLGLVGKVGEEPEIDADTLQGIYDDTSDAKSFASALRDWIKKDQPAATPLSATKLVKLYDADLDDAEEADARRLLSPVSLGDDDLLDFLVDWSRFIRRDLRGIPLVIPVGGLVVVETPSRKNAGAHYTPRSLAEEVVLHSLQPLVYEPGPLQTNDESEWRLKSSTAILDLKVADIAAGSGAFLVAAARYLADRVSEAWIAEGRLGPDQLANPQAVKDQAIREVIGRCLYGADINPMAVEMCKLSLWLVSMDKTKPFSFVDDKIFCGNSLLGITDLDQLRYLHLYPNPETMDPQLLGDIEGKVAEAIRLRMELASPVDEQNAMRSTLGKLALFAQLSRATAELRSVADGIIATGLPLAGKPGRKMDAAYKALSWEVAEAFPVEGSGDFSALHRRNDIGLRPTVETDYERWKPVHWVLEAPDVLVGRGGFDAVIGNPAFLHSKKISAAFGVNYRTYLQSILANGMTGDADLAAYFLLRQHQLVADDGIIGIVVTKSINQSNTRRVGLQQVLLDSELLNVSPVFDWGHGDASVSVLMIWLRRTMSSVPLLGHDPVPPLGGPPVKSFVGTYPNGDGFRLSRRVAERWISDDRSSREVLFPYVRASDLSYGSPRRPEDFLIDVHGRDEVDARRYDLVWRYLEENQRPWRSRPSVKPRLRENWWWFESAADALYRRLGSAKECIVLPRTSNLLMPRFAPAGFKFDMGVVVFPTDSSVVYGQIASSLHYHWVLSYAATTRDDPSYAPKRVGDTFPWIKDAREDEEVVRFAAAIENLCAEMGGLRPVMNDFNSSGRVSPAIDDLRDLYIDLDRRVLGWFGWADLRPTYDVRDRNNLQRFTIDPVAQNEVLVRLLELNAERGLANG